MKKYAVLKKMFPYAASTVREFDVLNDAKSFKDILKSSEEGYWEYYLVEVLE
jgi:hypothetical protein